MRVLEIIQPNNDKQQLDEVLPFLAIAAGSLVLNYLGGLAVDKVALGIRAWSDDLAVKNYKPTGKHIPDQTQITKGDRRFVYNAKEGVWGVQKRSKGGMIQGKWRYIMLPGSAKKAGPFKTVDISSNDLKTAIKNKTLSFGNKKAVVAVMQLAHVASGGTAGKAALASSGNLLQDLIDKEEGNLSKAGKARLAGKTKWGLVGRTAGAIFSRRSFQILSVLMPMVLIINAKRLQAWYEYKLNYGKGDNPFDTGGSSKAVGTGFPFILDDGSVRDEPYNSLDYDYDIRGLRSMVVAASTAWIVAGGVAVLSTGIMSILPFAKKKNKVIEAVEKKNFSKALVQTLKTIVNPSKWPGLIGKMAKVATGAVSAGLVYGAFDRAFAEKLAEKMADIIMSKPFGVEISPEEYYSELAEVLDLNWDAGMQIIGLGTTADDNLAKVKKDNKGNTDNKVVPGNDTSNSSNANVIDQVTQGNDFWKD